MFGPHWESSIHHVHNLLSPQKTPDLCDYPLTPEPVDIRTFIKDPRYCGDGGFWERPLQELEIICSHGCKGAVIEKGIRGSKSYTVSYIPVYYTYRLLHEEIVKQRDPRVRYELDPVATVIYNAIFSINGKLARRLYYYIANFVGRCEWFKHALIREHIAINPNITSEIQFCPVVDGRPQWRTPRYVIYPGHSMVSSAAGVALFSYILDECNLFTVAASSGSSGKDYAEEIDEELDKRVSSSFGVDGARIYISRRNVRDDFTARKKAAWEGLDGGSERYHLPPPKTSWDDWPDNRKHAEKWREFDTQKLLWLSDSVEYDAIKDREGFFVPARFFDDFDTNPESALKVLGSIPSEAQEPYIRRRDKIQPSFDLANPVLPHVKPEDWMADVPKDRLHQHFATLLADWFVGDAEERYHFHVDLAARWDACGLAIGHSSGIDEIAKSEGETRAEKTALIDIDAIICIRAPKGGEIEFERVREILYWLRRDRGFRFRTSSYDGWQSRDSLQILRGKGFVMEELSLDRTIEHYRTFKDALYEGRVFFPPAHGQTENSGYEFVLRRAELGDPCAIFQRELHQLEVIGGKKIDHPARGSKDLADAGCGVVVQCTRFKRTARDY